MRWTWLVVASAVACSSEQAIVRLGPQRYFKPEFEHFLRERIEAPDPYSAGDEVLSRMLDKFINQKVFELAIAEKQLVLAPGELERVEARLRPAESTDAHDDAWRKSLQLDLLTDKYIAQYLTAGCEATPAEIDAHYRSHQDQFRLPERFSAREIVLYDRGEAEKVRKQLLGKGVSAFADMAQKISKGPSAARGGQMGERSKGQLPAEIEDAIARLGPGQISAVVQTAYGFHIFLLEVRLPEEILPPEAVGDRIRQELVQRKIRKRVDGFLAERRAALGLKIIEKNLGFKYVEEVRG